MYGKPLAYIVKINEINPIEDADRIEIAKVMDYSVVVKKGEYKPGDFAMYVEIDSLLPDGLDNAEDRARMDELTSMLKSDPDNADIKTEIAELTAKSKYPYFEFLRARKFKIKSMKLGNNLKHKREGFILRRKEDMTVSFKVKNPEYSI